MSTKVPTLDSISSFTNNGNGTVTAAVKYTFFANPTYVYSSNTYIVGQKVCITGTNLTANSGVFTIQSYTGNTAGAPTGTIVFSNSAGTTDSNQFALCSPAPVLVKSVTNPIVTAAQSFSYLFSPSSGWNPPPSYGGYLPAVATVPSGSSYSLTGGQTAITTSFQTGTITSITITYPYQSPTTLTRFGFLPRIYLPYVSNTMVAGSYPTYISMNDSGVTFLKTAVIYNTVSGGSNTIGLWDGASYVTYQFSNVGSPYLQLAVGTTTLGLSLYINNALVGSQTFNTASYTWRYITMNYAQISVAGTPKTFTTTYMAPVPIPSEANYTGSGTPNASLITSDPALAPFFSPQGFNQQLVSSSGFNYIPATSLSYSLQLVDPVTSVVVDTYSDALTVTPIPITVSPTLVSPATFYGYTPFAYTFTVPALQNITLTGTSSDSALSQYISSSVDNQILYFSSPGTSNLVNSKTLVANVYAFGNSSPVGSNRTVVSIVPMTVSISPSIVGGVVSLYKYEPFEYTFTPAYSGSILTLQYVNSSAQLLVYCSNSDAQTVKFRGTPPASYSGTYFLVIDVLDGSTFVNTLTYSVTISPGRIQVSPASPYAFRQYETISNTLGSYPVLTLGSAIDSLVSVPSLPLGLSFSTNLSNLVGKPILIQSQKNYQLIGSNSSNGSIITTTIAIAVGSPVVRITPSAPTFSALTIASTPTATFTALTPNNSYANTFFYMWSPSLPSGLRFTDIDGNTQPYGNSFDPPDASNTIILTGTPDMTDAFGFPSSGVVNIALSGYYRDTTNVTTIGTASLSFQFAETVLMTATASSTLYHGKALGSNDVVITAASYFPSTGAITTFTSSALPPPLVLNSNSATFPTRWWLTGTPVTSSGTYTFTATNTNGKTTSIPLAITVNPDVVTFSTTADPSGWRVSAPLDGSFYVRATATSGSAITYSCSPDLSAYGLVFNTTTGVITGIPTSSVTNLSVTFTATDSLGASATRTNLITISPDVFTWPTPTLQWFQNRAITPYQIVVATASGRAIQTFSSMNMPAGLVLSQSGLITGTPTGTSGTSFTVLATTGYQAPASASNSFAYTIQSDNLLILQTNEVDPISNTFSNISFKTIQYSSDTFVNSTYSISSTYPIQYPAPVLSITSGGVLSGTLPVVPYSRYAANIVATYAGTTGTSTSVLTLNNTPTPFMLAGFTTATPSSSNYAQMTSTSSYVYTVDATGAQVTTNQSWGSVYAPSPSNQSTHLYPDLAQIGTAFMAVTVSNVYDGVYNFTTNSVVWTDIPSRALATPTTTRYGCVATDGLANWMVVQMTSPITRYLRVGTTGSWGTRIGTHSTNDSGESTLGYIGGRFVYGQAGDGATYCNVLYSASPYTTWTAPATPPTFSNILRFVTSSNTIVAVGSGAGAGVPPISYSTDSGTTWIRPTTPVWLRGPTVVINDIVVGNGSYVICGLNSFGSNFVAGTNDLSNWYYIYYTGDSIRWSALAFNGNAWAVAGSYRNPSTDQLQARILSMDPNATAASQTMSISPFQLGTIYSSSVVYFSKVLTSAFSNTSSFTGTLTIPAGSMSFTAPTQSNFLLYKYVPYTIPIQITGASPFIYYYAANIPPGFTFTPDPTGTSATLTGIPTTAGQSTTLIYAKTATGAPVAYSLSLNTVIPFFISPRAGAGAYTALLRNEVEANAAQNARDNKTYPQVNPLAGPFMGPRAPDVMTISNCGVCTVATGSGGQITTTTLPATAGAGQDAFIARYTLGGDPVWAQTIRGTSTDQAFGIATDSTGVYVTGYYTSSSVVSLGNGVTLPIPDTTINNTTGDAFIIKYDLAGAPLWAQTIPGTVSDAGYGLAVDSTGVYVSGYYNGYLSSGVSLGNGITLPATTVGNDVFVAKYSLAGVAQWATAIPAYTNDIGYGIAVDSSGVYVTGAYRSNTLTINLGNGVTLPTTVFDDGFVVKYSLSGVAQWARTIGGSGNVEFGFGIAVDSTGVYVTGVYSSPSIVSLGNGITLPAGVNGASSWDGYIVKYDLSGTPQWAQTIRGNSGDGLLGIATDSTGVYVSGYYDSTSTIPLGNGVTLPISVIRDAFIVKYDLAGTPLWAQTIRGTTTGMGYRIATDSTGVYASGYYQSTSTVSLGNGVTLPISNQTTPNPDAYIVKYDLSGTPQWATTIPGTGTDLGWGIAVNSTGVYVSGYYQSTSPVPFGVTVVGDPTPIVDLGGGSTLPLVVSGSGILTLLPDLPVTLPATGSNDAFIIKYDSIATPLWAKPIPTLSINDSAYGIAVDSTGVYVSGVYVSTSILSLGNGVTLPETVVNAGFTIKYDLSGTALWAQAIRANPATGYGIAVDSTGVYVCGSYYSTSVVDLGNAITLPGAGATTREDVFIVKYSLSGVAQWAQTIMGTGTSEAGYGITVDSTGVYVTGRYISSSTITLGGGVTIPASVSSGYDPFIVKYDLAGTPLWAQTIRGTSTDTGYGIAVDSTGVYVTGSYQSISTVSLGNGVTLASTSGGTDAYIVKYDLSGVAQWATTIPGLSSDIGYGIAANSTGVYASGYYQSTSTVSLGNGVTLAATSGGVDAYIVKYDLSGTPQWATTIPGLSSDIGYGIAVDSTSVYVTGSYLSSSPVNVGNGYTLPATSSQNGFIISYDTSGTTLWTKLIPGTLSDGGRAIVTNSTGIYVSGFYTSASEVTL